MVLSRQSAIDMMNHLGSQRIPFLFVVDYEMKAIRIHRLDQILPPDVHYSFHQKADQSSAASLPFIFRKHPVPFAQYEEAFTLIRNQILAGNSFLANLTFPTLLETNLSLAQIYEISHAPYKIMIDDSFVCFSPEAFITIKDGTITTRPMKGTIKASVPEAEKVILKSAKETAEHVTVVDLLRNDLSIIAEHIMVERFRYIDRIHSSEGAILQVSSKITGQLPKDFHFTLGDMLFAMLPAGSVTGAPKKKTISIIQKAEKSERGYYTGVCGVYDGENLDSAVMIRFIELKDGTMRFRSGGGITFLSNSHEEYNEMMVKVYVPTV
jgi:para-aminobenzoate synthetase component 1